MPKVSAANGPSVESTDFDAYHATDQELQQLGKTVANAAQTLREDKKSLAETAEKSTAIHRKLRSERVLIEERSNAIKGYVSQVAIGDFVAAEDGIEFNLADSVQSVRRAGVLEVVTGDLVKQLKQATAQLKSAKLREEAALDDKNQAAAALKNHEESLRQASNELQRFNGAVQLRNISIANRTHDLVVTQEEIPLTQVGPTMKVNEAIAENISALLAAAAAEGIEFGGWGYRPRAMQIVLRRAHCGSSEYALFDKSAGQCRPPTARPGSSQHELGLAVDFTQNGAILSSKSTGFIWLKTNAARFGLKNLPSEPWHWSTTGK